MYFDRRLWELTRGLRGRIALAILIGLAAAAFGIARFVLLGALLARVFTDAGFVIIAILAAGVAASVLLRATRLRRRSAPRNDAKQAEAGLHRGECVPRCGNRRL